MICASNNPKYRGAKGVCIGVLVHQMREMEEERHFLHLRMSKYRFDDLLRRITPYI